MKRHSEVLPGQEPLISDNAWRLLLRICNTSNTEDTRIGQLLTDGQLDGRYSAIDTALLLDTAEEIRERIRRPNAERGDIEPYADNVDDPGPDDPERVPPGAPIVIDLPRQFNRGAGLFIEASQPADKD